jgi:hypothetical protein
VPEEDYEAFRRLGMRAYLVGRLQIRHGDPRHWGDACAPGQAPVGHPQLDRRLADLARPHHACQLGRCALDCGIED